MEFTFYLNKNAQKPVKAYDSDAGYDLFSPVDIEVPEFGSATIDTGVHILIPDGYAGKLCAKSGLNVKHNLISTGLIDAGYTGSIKVKLYNLSDRPYYVRAGDKISQIVFIKVESPELKQVGYIYKSSTTERGDNGFGSTGR